MNRLREIVEREWGEAREHSPDLRHATHDAFLDALGFAERVARAVVEECAKEIEDIVCGRVVSNTLPFIEPVCEDPGCTLPVDPRFKKFCTRHAVGGHD